MYINIHFDNFEAPEFFNSVYKGPKKLLGIRWNNFLVQFPSRKSAITAATQYKHYVTDKGYRSVPLIYKESVYAGIGNNSIKKEADLQTARQWVDFYWQFPSE
jgi:hypothetical protein